MVFIGVDIGTGSSKAVAVDETGAVRAQARRDHTTLSPAPGRFEHDANETWFSEPLLLIRQCVTQLAEQGIRADQVRGLGFSGIGPAVVPCSDDGTPLHNAILYGIDTRATVEIDEDTERIGREELMAHSGNLLSTQAMGPKLSWLARHEPQVWERTTMLHCSSSFPVFHLTGEYMWDRYTAASADPLYDKVTMDWWEPAWQLCAGRVRRPHLAAPIEQVGVLHAAGAEATGLLQGTAVVAGTIDAMAEAYSVGVENPGDTMLMYGSTLFMIQVTKNFAPAEPLWAVGGVKPGGQALAAGMSTGGLLIQWVADEMGLSVSDMMDEAVQSVPGAHGLVMLPYLSGERTPFSDPQARGVWLGLSIRHTRADLARSAIEAVGFGIRHNLDRMTELGARPQRLVAVGGGTQSDTWLQAVSDICQLPQYVPSITVGASYGDARMAAESQGVDTSGWNADGHTIEPNPSNRETLDELFEVYLSTYPALKESMHTLARYNV